MSGGDVHNESSLTRPSLLWINQFAILPSDGGGTRHFELGRELVRLGWDVTIVASDFHMHKRAYSRRREPDDRAAIVETVDGVQFRWLWASPYQRNDWRRAWNWLSFARSVRADGRRIARPSVVIGSSPQLFAARAGQSVARARAIPFVMEVRDLWPESLIAAGGRKGPGYHALDAIARSMYRAAERIIVLAKGTATYLESRGVAHAKLIYVPNGVDVNSVVPAVADSGTDGFTVVYAGAHGPFNGLEAVLDAAEILGAESGVRFLLIGDGPSREALRAARDARGLHHVEFRDSMSKPDLFACLRTADAGLMVLRDAELFSFAVSPNKLFDYFGAGLPVVCNVPGEVAGMVSESGAGLQAGDTSGRALADAIARMRALPAATIAAMREQGREWVERNHSREVLGASLDRHLRALIQSP